MTPGRRTIRAPETVVRQIRGLHPRLKHKVKKALAALADDSFLGKPLKYELEGLSRSWPSDPAGKSTHRPCGC